MMKRRGIALFLILAMTVCTVGGCGEPGQESQSADVQNESDDVDAADAQNQTNDAASVQDDDDTAEEQISQSAKEETEDEEIFFPTYTGPFSVKDAAVNEDIGVTPCVTPYTIEPDLSNIDNLWQFYLGDEQKEKIAQNGFVVCGDAGREFFEIYERNRYVPVANFVTVDSLMHTYHLYFAHLLKKVEKGYLAGCLKQLSDRMLAESLTAYDALKGSEWEEAAKCNVAFFTVGAKLLDDKTEIDTDVKETVEYELEHIIAAEGIDGSRMYDSQTGAMEDYTQYMPRGYYEGDEELERYFRAMMWYGRIHFRQDSEEMNRSAFLMAQALIEDEEAYQLWGSIYEVTSFFSGASDDAGVYEYIPLIKEVYGENVTIADLIGNEEAFNRFHAAAADLRSPMVNSLVIRDGESNVIPGFRFMGQRFTIDAAVMQKLIYSNVQEAADGSKRMLPDVLDVPATLGSDTALSILEQSGVTKYPEYTENMNLLRGALAAENKEMWSGSLYSNWLNTLRPLLEVKGEGYPMFMQSEEWRKKDLECFAGSFTELKHDTILYTKQVLAEMGDAYDDSADDRGYVEPEPLVYLRFKNLSDLTAQGLKNYGMLSEEEEANLSLLSEMADTLLEISKKELRDEVLTDDEYEFIRGYGGSIEHFWMETVRDLNDGNGVATQEAPAALVVDIATNPNGEVLEAGTDDPSTIYVVVKVDGKIKIASGSVYTFYQFDWPMEDRLTDSKWHQMLGIKQNEEGMFTNEKDPVIKHPEWTESYRYE
ncbi:MAG: DUF3160 domain-containing protein [Lachnospiraceae bacterium]|nr:DUF3160 domain-containing protein [Lachnospiraceae bacterium]